MKELDSFTVEQLNDFIKSDHAQCGDVAALARIALAAKRAEPVTWWTGPEPTKTGELESYHDHETGSHYLPLVVSLSAYNTTPQLNSPEIPEGWPTEDMVIAGFESGAWDALSSAVLKRQGWPYSCRESAECVTGIFKAMLAAAPEKENG
ncbi:TPA: hypothetical protein ACJCXE_004372 [Yersinia enterocolitica]|nr:hypothetical protein [Yersinia enterocolitica]HDL6782971.1 hypothetical protein [Yersinia enterocolitica]HDL7743543.1 hypothetical protein [Yersinia enterocolitica]HDL8249916.1 hypothetical protein [Yersinia enterocolitica]HDM8283895.1 hypothetical protein [Yersinia enterocolitica]